LHECAVLDAVIEDTIRVHARSLIGQAGITRQELKDIEQELRLTVLMRLSKYDPSRGKRATFLKHVVTNACASIVRRRRAEMRALTYAEQSLDDEVETDDGVALYGDLVERSDIDRRLGQATRSEGEQRELRMDLSLVVASLPEELRGLCEDLKTKAVVQIAAERGMSRVAVYRRIRRLRESFDAMSMRDYVTRTDTGRVSGA